LSRAVCRTCWTWYANGESVCPNCRTRLAGGDPHQGQPAATSRPAPLQPTADAPFPAPAQASSSGIRWPIWLLIGGGALALVAVVGLMALGLLVTGALGPVTSSDAAFSVSVPKGWSQSTTTVTGAKPVMTLVRLKQTNGVETHFLVEDIGKFVPLSTIEAGWDPFLRSGAVRVGGTFGPLGRTAVGGAPALTIDFDGSKYSGQLLFVDYGNKTYIVEMLSDPGEFDRLRDSDFSSILSSWQWQ
jgi:hypothetical protein